MKYYAKALSIDISLISLFQFNTNIFVCVCKHKLVVEPELWLGAGYSQLTSQL